MNSSWIERESALLQSLAARHNVPLQAVQQLALELGRTRGRAVRFDIPALGGEGRWQSGQRASVGNGFNEELNDTVTALCRAIASALQDKEDTLLFERTEVPSPSVKPANGAAHWWPTGYGEAALSGLISGMRYAYFPAYSRLLLQQNLRTRFFDTGGYIVQGLVQTDVRGFPGILVQTNKGPVLLHTLVEVDS